MTQGNSAPRSNSDMQKPDDNPLKMLLSPLIGDTEHLDTRVISPIHHVNMLLKQLEREEIPILPVIGKVMPKEKDVALPAIPSFN